MNLYEYEAKQIFAEFGIPVPSSKRVSSVNELKGLDLAYPITLKCQVLSGGRGKAGGIKFASNLKEAETLSNDLLKMVINGSPTESLLIEPKLAIQKIYLSCTLDRSSGSAIFIASKEGGIEIELSHNVTASVIPIPYSQFVGRKLGKQIGLQGKLLLKFADIANRLYGLFEARDLDLAEINPLVITESEDLIALDGKMVVNDDALDRQKYFAGWQERHLEEFTQQERKAKLFGLNLVELDGSIGILCNGAGLTMATMDMVKGAGGKPANFLDVGGGSDQDKTLRALDIVNENANVKVILLNILGGITACDEVAKALVKFIKANPSRTLVVRLRGNNQDLAEKILADSGVKLIPNLTEAVETAVAKAA